MAEGVAENGPFCFQTKERRSEEGRRAQRSGTERAVEENETRSARGGKDLIVEPELVAEIPKNGGAAETLRAEFEKEAVAEDGVDDAAGAGGGFDEMCVDAGFAEGVGADEAGDSAADHQCWDVTGHRVVSILAGSESF